jgi:hypothetical protein
MWRLSPVSRIVPAVNNKRLCRGPAMGDERKPVTLRA